jgi:Skp family chaperone for outer membrane proteins
MKVTRTQFWISFFIAALISLIHVHGALAAEGAAPVLVIDMDRALRESISGKAAIANVEDERKKRGQVLMKLDQDLKKLDEAIQKQAGVLSAQAIAEKREQFEKKRIEGSRKAQDMQREMMKFQQGEFSKVMTTLEQIMKTLAEERGGKFIFDYDKRVVLFAAESIDVTDEAIEALDEQAMKS